MIINIDNRPSNFGVGLFTGSTLSDRLHLLDIITTTTTIVDLVNIQETDVYKVYDFFGGVLTELEDYKLSYKKLILSSIPSGNIIIFSKKALQIIQLSTQSNPVQIFTKTIGEIEAKDTVISSYNFETASAGEYLFSETQAGVYEETLNLSDLPSSFWIKSNLSSYQKLVNIPIILTTDIYL